LATEFKVNYKTIYKWTCRDVFTDKQSNRPSKPSKTTTQFVSAVEAYGKDPTTSHHGKVRIAQELKKTHSCSNASNVYTVLKRLKLNQPKQRKEQGKNTIPVGKHRTQMDIQFLPAIEGNEGFSYKISIIDLSTRIKYSEILGIKSLENLSMSHNYWCFQTICGTITSLSCRFRGHSMLLPLLKRPYSIVFGKNKR
jgi:transposase